MRGFDLIYWAGRLRLNATVNLYWASPEGDHSSIDIRLALGAIYPVISTEHAELGATYVTGGGGFTVLF